jgi:prepilin-type N-terminal cleavage/methylation domain-containing protein
MNRPNIVRRPSPKGFTLVELLVVIAIIGMLTAIAVPTIFSAVASARNAKTKAEIDMLQMAVMNYKNEYGSFPPANMSGLWSGSAVNTNHVAYKHLVRVFPRLSEATSGANSPYYTMSRMSPAQALVFWLQGFYENPEYPLTNGGSSLTSPNPGSRKRLFDFDETRLYAAKMPYDHDGPDYQAFAPRNSDAFTAEEKALPVYFTGHPSSGLPYVYFDSRCYDKTPSQDVSYRARTANGDESVAFPYITATPPPSPTWGQCHAAGETFQLIAAGKDGLYGQVQVAFPRATGNSYTPPPSGAPSYPYADDTASAPGHADNIVNFAERALADAIEALKAK